MLITRNKKIAYHYTLLDTYTAGIVLTGPEVKAVKKGRINLSGSYASIEGNEVWLKHTHIARYLPAGKTQERYNATQTRKLLLNRKEINTLIGKTAVKGVSLVPLAVHNNKGLIKIEIALVRGKKKHDKREVIKKREFERRKQQMLKNRKFS